jgi:hypothetical protein
MDNNEILKILMIYGKYFTPITDPNTNKIIMKETIINSDITDFISNIYDIIQDGTIQDCNNISGKFTKKTILSTHLYYQTLVKNL